MVVVIVIAVVSVTIVTSIGRSTDRSARLEANRFMAVVNEVRDEAVVAGDNFVLLVDKKAKTYQFQTTRAGASTQLNDALFKTRSMRDDINVDWEVLEVLEESSETDPKVFITSLGEITPFEIRMGGDKHDYIVFVNDEGQLERRERTTGF